MTKIDTAIMMIIVLFCMSLMIGAIHKRNETYYSNPIDINSKLLSVDEKKPVDAVKQCPVEPWIDQMDVLKKFLYKGDPNYKEDENR